jgi:hypothetical protein
MHQPTMVQVEASQDSSRRLAASTNGQPTNGRFKSHLHGIHGNTETPPNKQIKGWFMKIQSHITF